MPTEPTQAEARQREIVTTCQWLRDAYPAHVERMSRIVGSLQMLRQTWDSTQPYPADAWVRESDPERRELAAVNAAWAECDKARKRLWAAVCLELPDLPAVLKVLPEYHTPDGVDLLAMLAELRTVEAAARRAMEQADRYVKATAYENIGIKRTTIHKAHAAGKVRKRGTGKDATFSDADIHREWHAKFTHG